MEAAGTLIGEIHVITEDIFDLEDPEENNWFYRLANALHVKTKPEVIRRTLLFKTGEPLSVRVIEETERLLRASRYLYDVSIRPVAYADGVVDIEVRTRDTWSLDVSVGGSRAGGENTGRVSVGEENLAGTGIQVGIAYSKDVDRSGTTFQLGDNNVLGTRANVAYTYAKYDDGSLQSFGLARPFYSLDTRWAAGFAASDSDGLGAVYNAGNSVAEYRLRRRFAEAFGGWSPGLVGRWVLRYSAGVSSEDNDYEPEPGKTVPERLPSDLTLVGPFLRFELVEDDFRKDVNLNLIGRIEDLTFGLQSTLQIGRALENLGSTRDAWLYTATLGRGFDITKDSFLLTSAGASGRYAETGENQFAGVSAQYYLRSGPRLVYYVAASAQAAHNPDIPSPLYIGGDSGLRGYPLRYQSGEKRALLTLEARAYSDWYPFRLFRVGGAVFYDTGRAWDGEVQNTANAGWLRDVGFGLRLLSARTAKGNVLHADFAFPLDPDPSIKKAQFLVKSRVSF